MDVLTHQHSLMSVKYGKLDYFKNVTSEILAKLVDTNLLRFEKKNEFELKC